MLMAGNALVREIADISDNKVGQKRLSKEGGNHLSRLVFMWLSMGNILVVKMQIDST
jgi:hypothetical protein